MPWPRIWGAGGILNRLADWRFHITINCAFWRAQARRRTMDNAPIARAE
jgi:hypothetical protein